MYTFYQPPVTPHLAASDSNVFEGKDELLKLGLCPLVPNRNVETEFWVEEKKIALPGKGGHSRLMP